MNNVKNKIVTQKAPATTQALPGDRFVYAQRPWAQQVLFIRNLACRSPALYLTVFTAWALSIVWFQDRLYSIMDMAEGFVESMSLLYFIVFTQIAWLYGIYNLTVVIFSGILRDRAQKKSGDDVADTVLATSNTPVAVLYTTCNDFVLESAISCLSMDYENFKIYILDDSDDPEYRSRIDRFAALSPAKIKVIRRQDRKGFKAGNLNHALQKVVTEPLFVIADADEIMPADFLSRLVPRIEADPNCGFIQANHKHKHWNTTQLERDMGIGIDIHWKRYQPLRNYYGFVMFLGHGALLRTECWKLVGGFPELVSEDLAYALAIREYGYYGTFAEDVTCYEEFPDSVRAFRVRHVKWTRGTCEFLGNQLWPLLRSPFVSWVEKVDVLFPTLNLPLTFCFFVFMLNAGLLIPSLFGEIRPLTLVIAGHETTLPLVMFADGFNRLFSPDFFAITFLTILGPVLCFIVEMWRTPLRLFRFLAHSTSLYAALSPLSAICVAGYAITRKARFLVTGDISGGREKRVAGLSPVKRVWKFLCETHPDHAGVVAFELTSAAVFMWAALQGLQISFLGISLAFMLLPVMHFCRWENPILSIARYLPFVLVLSGLTIGGMGLFGVAPVLFGFGFHF